MLGQQGVHLLIGAEATESGGGGVCRATASARSLTKFAVSFAPAKDDGSTSSAGLQAFFCNGFQAMLFLRIVPPFGVVAVLKGHGSE